MDYRDDVMLHEMGMAARRGDVGTYNQIHESMTSNTERVLDVLDQSAKAADEVNKRRMSGPNDFQHSEEHLKAAVKAYCSPFPNNGYIASADEIKSALNDVDAEHVVLPKPSNEEIALRLVEAWARQTNFSVICDGIVDRYFEALDRLNENESKDA